jgi:hypothetical protein
MVSMRKLRAEARQAATGRGHELKKFSHLYRSPSGFYSVASCRLCMARVRVEPYPAPNSASIWGEAVGLGCPGTGWNSATMQSAG